MPDENRVFDVARPGHGSPQPTSKPIIVGHHPTMSDPMVMDENSADGSHLEASPTRISVQDESPVGDDSSDHLFITPNTKPEEAVPEYGQSPMAPGPFSENAAVEESTVPDYDPGSSDAAPAVITEPGADAHTDSSEVPLSQMGSEDTHYSHPPEVSSSESHIPDAPLGHVEGLHMSPHKRRSPLKAIVLILLLLIVGAYLAVDAGAVGSGIKLPFHVFKQKAAVTTPPATTNNQAASPSALPAGFSEYKLADTSITFAAPTAWGEPTSSSDPGYSSRSATPKSDGTYAYIVDFATNKDVEVAVTSGKFLPAARDARYYDFLGWCNGTNDSKIYLSTLKFTTVDKVDTPTTASCDAGPVVDPTKINATTIVQLKAKNTEGVVVGDLYTKNLNNTALPVFRVFDKTSTNSTNVKLVLATVKIPAAQ